MKFHLFALILAVLVFSCTQPQTTSETEQEDPYLWLEEIESEQSLDWVKARNASSDDVLKSYPQYESLKEAMLKQMNDPEKIAYPTISGMYVYNFWQDDVHERGIWRRMNKKDYVKGAEDWETVLDLDELSATEDKKWVFKGADIYSATANICLIELSDGGTDKSELREFNLETKDFVQDGFYIPASKGGAGWIDENTLLFTYDFGAETMTAAGYPKIAKVLKRGQRLEDAELIFEADSTVAGVWPYTLQSSGNNYAFVFEWVTAFETRLHYFIDNKLIQIEYPQDAEVSTLYKEMLILTLQSDWTLGDQVFKAGDVVSYSIDAFLNGNLEVTRIYHPDVKSSLNSLTATSEYLVLNIMQNVQGKLLKSRYDGTSWTNEEVDVPDFASIELRSANSEGADYFFYYSNLIIPNTLMYDDGKRIKEVKALKSAFNSSNLEVHQYEAKSKDGTMIPYFIVHQKDIKLDRLNPTLVYAYGGFNSSSKPRYSSSLGLGWLNKGGVYVLANIRGGGEFGPAWHQAAMKEKRQNAYDDFYAVTEDVIARNITSPEYLGAYGWSNGGLLAGVVLTQRPDLYKAVIVGAPLLDMKRYSKMLAGASWIGEYGDPDNPEEWEYISQYSPYHNVSSDKEYPEALILTSTKDDRVHPGHARKMVAKMMEMGHPVLYHETIEGGHGAASTNDQQAELSALMYSYLNIKLNNQLESSKIDQQ